MDDCSVHVYFYRLDFCSVRTWHENSGYKYIVRKLWKILVVFALTNISNSIKIVGQSEWMHKLSF